MKFYISGFPNLLDKIKNLEINSLLLYGPDKGYINKIIESIKKKFSMWSTTLTYQDFNEKDLSVLLNSQNFFNKRELIKVINVTNNLSDSVKNTLKGKFLHFPIFIADDLKAGVGIKKFFEDSPSSACIACYYDDQTINKIILNKCKTYTKTISDEAKIYLQTYLKGDSQLIRNELDKLIYFLGTRSNITLSDVKSVLSSELLASSDELCIYFAQKNLDQFLYQVNKLLAIGTNEILIIRALIRYYSNLYIVLSKIKSGDTLDSAIKSLSPAIFFKYINDFKKVAITLNIHEIISTLQNLQEAEISFKLNPKNFDFYEHIFNNSHSKIYSTSHSQIIVP